jgi:hypothetical protein
MKRYILTLLTLLAMGIGTQALAEEETQTAASTDMATAVSDTSPAATDASTDAAADASAAPDPMPTSTGSDSK